MNATAKLEQIERILTQPYNDAYMLAAIRQVLSAEDEAADDECYCGEPRAIQIQTVHGEVCLLCFMRQKGQ